MESEVGTVVIDLSFGKWQNYENFLEIYQLYYLVKWTFYRH